MSSKSDEEALGAIGDALPSIAGIDLGMGPGKVKCGACGVMVPRAELAEHSKKHGHKVAGMDMEYGFSDSNVDGGFGSGVDLENLRW